MVCARVFACAVGLSIVVLLPVGMACKDDSLARVSDHPGAPPQALLNRLGEPLEVEARVCDNGPVERVNNGPKGAGRHANFVRGRVIDTSGRPVEDAAVRAIPLAGHPLVRTERSGEFEILCDDECPSLGDECLSIESVAVWRDGFELQMVPMASTGDRWIVVQLESKRSRRVVGRVLDPTGTGGVPGGLVSLREIGVHPSRGSDVQADSQGNFSTGSASAKVEVTAKPPAGFPYLASSLPVTLDKDSSFAELRLEWGGCIRVMHVPRSDVLLCYPDGMSPGVALHTGDLRIYISVGNRQIAIESLPAGLYSLRYIMKEGAPIDIAAVEVFPRMTTDVVVEVD